MSDSHPTLTIALPDGQHWTCRLRPEIAAQLVAAAQHATQVLGTTSPDCDVHTTPAECAARELEIALWGGSSSPLRSKSSRLLTPSQHSYLVSPQTNLDRPTHTISSQSNTVVCERLKSWVRAILAFWCRVLKERYDSGDVAGAQAEVYPLIDWLRHMMAYEPGDRHIVQAYARSLELLGIIEEHRFMSTGNLSARFHAAVLYHAALVACDEARLSANNSTRGTLRAALALGGGSSLLSR